MLLALHKRTCVPAELKLGVRPCVPTSCWLFLEIQQPCPGFVLALTGNHQMLLKCCCVAQRREQELVGVFVCFLLSKTGFLCAALTVLELSVDYAGLRLTEICLPSAGMKGLYHYATRTCSFMSIFYLSSFPLRMGIAVY